MKTKTKVYCVLQELRTDCKHRFVHFRCPGCKMTELEHRLEEFYFEGLNRQLESGLHEECKNGLCQRPKVNELENVCDLGTKCIYCYISILQRRMCKYIQMSLADVITLASKVDFQFQILNITLNCL